LTVTASPHDQITVRKFSLVNGKGENVLHKHFDRRQLADRFDQLSLKFHAMEKQFEFKFERSDPIFAPGANIRMTSNGNGYVEVPPPDILTFSSPQNDAAITFINSTALDGVLFQHDRAFDIVASEDLLTLSPVWHDLSCGLAPSTEGRHNQHHHEMATRGRHLSLADISRWTNCYTGEDKTHVMSIGLGVTSGLYESQFSKNLVTATAWVASIVARANVVFMRQMNVLLQVGDLIVVHPDSVGDVCLPGLGRELQRSTSSYGSKMSVFVYTDCL
jgi:hypothetical protein